MFLLTGLGYLILPNLFNGIGEVEETMKMAMVIVISFLPTAPLAVKIFHVPGLIIALIASTFLSLTYGLIKAQRKHGLKVDYKALAKICFATALASALTLALASLFHLSALIKIAIGSLSYLFVYLTAVALIGAIEKQDISNLTQIFESRKLIGSIAKLILSYEACLLTFKQP
jgi:O-antigen/teichoic acid export membrane protein